jgi:organic radical activating enzyme
VVKLDKLVELSRAIMPSNTVVAEYGGEMVVIDTALPVVETFHSLQGEGVHAGRSAFFIRLGGCSVGCSWCDTKHSWPEGVHPRVALLELAMQTSEAVAHGAAFAVVTGGEPLHHNLNDLCQALRQKTSHATGRPVPLHLETSGVDPLSGEFDWITLSPKRHKPPTPELLAACNELKVVVHNGDDLAFAEQMAVAARARCHRHRSAEPVLLLQPGANCPEGQTLAVGFVRTNPGWRLSLQTHKLLGVR